MIFEEAVEEFGEVNRKKKLDPYRDLIVNWLQEFPSLSGAQVYDWLLERYPDLDVGESTVRRYVKKMRDVYNIEKMDEPREYGAVDELPPGKQMQVDWGQTVQKTKQKKDVKLYFIAYVLAHSRQNTWFGKIVLLQLQILFAAMKLHFNITVEWLRKLSMTRII